MDFEQQPLSPPPKWTTMCTAQSTVAGNIYPKVPHPRSPCTSGWKSAAFSSTSFHLSSTPPAKRFQRVRNPFEERKSLAERMQLPLIGSPSLFQRPVTPQHSSTQFEWTIDEVSSLKPAHVEPHETQFHDSPDPDFEDKVQSAISSYFKEQQIVPSPVDCPLRNGRIILSELDGNTPISKPGRRIRDFGTQTELSLPAILPKELEEALRPYLQPHLNASDDRMHMEDTHCRDKRSSSTADTKDVSLRRKLFDMQNIIVVDNFDGTHLFNQQKQQQRQQKNSSPLHMMQLQHTAIVGKLSDSLDKSSFGSLSPISATDGLSISPHSPRYKDVSSNSCNDSVSKRKQRSRVPRFANDLDDIEHLSPIHPPARKAVAKSKPFATEQYREVNNTTENTFAALSTSAQAASSIMSDSDHSQLQEKFTPERSSSPMPKGTQKAELSVDSSFNVCISRLVVNSAKCASAGDDNSRFRSHIVKSSSVGGAIHDDTVDILDVDDDDMQVSQLSMQSSSSNSDTPRGKRRSASRKNLSQSFTSNWLETEEAEAAQRKSVADTSCTGEDSKISIPELHAFLQKQQQEPNYSETATNKIQNLAPTNSGSNTGVFYRVDSGFNEMTASSFGSVLQIDDMHAGAATTNMAIPTIEESTQHDMSVMCSTPSKHGDTTIGGVV